LVSEVKKTQQKEQKRYFYSHIVVIGFILIDT